MIPDLTLALPSNATSLNPLGRVRITSYTCLPPWRNFVMVLAIDILTTPSAALLIPTCISANRGFEGLFLSCDWPVNPVKSTTPEPSALKSVKSSLKVSPTLMVMFFL